MTYTVGYVNAAKRQLRKLPREVAEAVVKAVRELAEDPRPDGCRKIAGGERLWRIKVARVYRVTYLVDDAAKIVEITEIAHRSKAYR